VGKLSRGTEASTTAEERAWAALARLFRVLAHQNTASWLGVRLTISQFKVLILCRERAHTVTEIAQELGVSPPTVTPVLNRLVGEGLIQRRRDRKDRRVLHITLTPAGQDLVGRLHEGPADRLRAALGDLSEEELVALAQGVEALATALAKAAAGVQEAEAT